MTTEFIAVVTQIVDEIPSTELIETVAAAETVLEVDDATQFREPTRGRASQLRITDVDDDETFEIADIESIDDNPEPPTITLTAGLVNAYGAESLVEVEPRFIERHAMIQEDTDGGAPISARIAHHLVDRLSAGTRSAGGGEIVVVRPEGDGFLIVDVRAQEPVVDGSFIEPDTVPIPDTVPRGDGLAPPDPTAAPEILRGAPARNIIDMTAYDRPEDFQSFLGEFAISDDGGETFGAFVELGPSGSLQIHDALDYALRYKYRYRVLDIEGLMSGYSPETEAVVPRKVGEEGAVDIAADSVVTEMLAALIVLASMLRVENEMDGRVDIGDGAIRAFDAEGEETFRVDGVSNFMNGTLVTVILTVLENLVIRLGAELSGGAVMELGTGVSDPAGIPQSQWELESDTLGTGTGNRQGLKHTAAGGAAGSTSVFVGGQGGTFREWLSATLAQNRSKGFGGDYSQVHGAVKLGTHYHLMGKAAFGGAYLIGQLNIADLSEAGSGSISRVIAGLEQDQVGGIATDGTDVFMCEANRPADVVRVHRMTAAQALSGNPTVTQSWNTAVELADGENVRDMEIHDGKWWFLVNIVGQPNEVRVCLEDGGARSAADDFTTNGQGGLTWDGDQFMVSDRSSSSGNIYTHTNWLQSSNVHFAYSYYDTTNDDETALSGIGAYDVSVAKRRWSLRLGVPSIPVGADRIRYYMLEATSATVGTMKQQAESASTSVLLSYNALGATTAVSVTEFPADSAAEIRSFSGDTVISGDDNHTWPLRFCKARRTTAQTISNATDTAVEWSGADEYDSDNMHNAVTNNTRITPGKAGYYSIKAQVVFASNVTGRRIIRIRLNGTDFIGESTVGSPGAAELHLQAVVDRFLDADDYVEVVVFQNSGGNLALENADDNLWFSVHQFQFA